MVDLSSGRVGEDVVAVWVARMGEGLANVGSAVFTRGMSCACGVLEALLPGGSGEAEGWRRRWPS